MRSRIAALGVVIAVATGLAGFGAVALAAMEVEESGPLAAAAGPAAAATGLPSVEDHCYIEGMVPHHEQALQLSRLVLEADGVRDRTRALAEYITADQAAEIRMMRSWQSAWAKATAAGSPGSSSHSQHDDVPEGVATGCGGHAHGEMSGMATPEQLAALAAAEGAVADRLFLELMVVHHEGALAMATQAVTEGSNAFVRSSGKHVLVEQEREITAMNALLAELS